MGIATRWPAVVVVVLLTVGFAVSADRYEPASSDDAPAVPSDGEPEVVAPDAPMPELRRIAVRLFERRSTALLAGKRAAFMRQIDPADPEFRQRQAMLFGNVQRMPFSELSYTVDDVQLPSATEAYGVPSYLSWVRVRHRLAGFDGRPLGSPIAYTLVQRDGDWRIASDSDVEPAGQRLEPWDLAPLRVHNDGSMLVVTDAARPWRLVRAVRLGRRAFATIDRTLSVDWPHRVVLFALTDEALFEEYGTGEFAAITSTWAGATRVVVNLAAPNLNPGVVTHELTHVALRNYDQAPSWLHEGIATYVEAREYTAASNRRYARAFVPRARTAWPAMPSSASFSMGQGVQWLYVLSWMACEYIAAEYGVPRLIDLLRAMERRPPVFGIDGRQDGVLRRELGIDEAALATRAADYLVETYSRA
jgi:hypothetical protein